MNHSIQSQYPIYIVSKNRWQNTRRLTAITLEEMCHPYYIVVEADQYDQYMETTNPKYGTVLILPQEYLDNYDTFDDLGNTVSKGPGAARNFCWDHSKANGFKWHWVMDDNMRYFYRLHENLRVVAETGAIFRACEDFVDRFSNVYISGMNYKMFCPPQSKYPAYVTNTRIYSCLLIRNDIPYRWRGRYNEDTDLSLRVLKDGFCTVQFNAFLCGKAPTQTVRGGNSAEFYDKNGTHKKSEMIVEMHPDVARLMMRFGRAHHYVDYSGYKQPLIREANAKKCKGNYGMIIYDTEKHIKADINDPYYRSNHRDDIF